MYRILLNMLASICFLCGCSRIYMNDFSGPPVFHKDSVEVVAELSGPPGNIAVSHDHRIFFTFHPDGDPEIKVAEWTGGVAVPFPDSDFQKKKSDKPFFDTVLSLRIDAENRLWTLDHGYFGIRQPRLMAFDIRTGEVLHQHDFPSDTAGFGSFLNDFQVTSSGDTIFIADTGAPVPLIGGDPAIVVYNVKTKTARRVLEDHESVRASDKTLRIGQEDFSLMGMALKIAVDSIALDRDNQWLYYGAVNGENLYRIRAEDLTDQTLSPERLASRIEVFAEKTMSDGITTDLTGNIYLSDMENSAVHVIGQDRRLKSLIKDPAFRWPDGFSFGPDGWLYFTCSDLMNVVGKSASHIREHAPYRIFRFKPGGQGIPGH
ncbi:MAG: hypothetical protein C4522_08205 [Desulfobacteraceae bacterium]|nr:MAG: hypothetical protein C4522_08205 [Desulfobacteraceae bacterium]